MVVKKAKMFFHQGWTDIINCLPLINYYSKDYDSLELIIRKDSKALVDFYLNQFDNVNPLYIEKSILDSDAHPYLRGSETESLMFFGLHDSLRTDGNRDSFRTSGSGFFVEKFYTSYNIPYEERINSFDIVRDHNVEDEIYKKVIGNYDGEYIVVHEDLERGFSIGTDNKDIKIIKLNGVSDVFFDYIKVLENAKSIHLMDSVWAAICYLLDAKYALLKNIDVTVHCLRGYEEMFIKPKKLPNWKMN
jgi:hypothetical protein